MLALEELERSWTTAFASSWTSTTLNCISLQRLRPSLNPQSSAIKLLEQPILLEKPPSHSSCLFLIRPPHPARPGFPTAALSVFRHAHSAWGLSHLTCTNLLLLDFLAFKPQCWNSKARKRAYLWTYGWACRFLKIATFLCFHNSQMVKGKMIHQGGCTPNLQMLLLQLFFSHSTRFLS